MWRFTNLRAIEEASYIVIWVKASKLHDARGIYDVRRIVNMLGSDLVKKELEALRKLIEDNNIAILQDVATIEEIHRALRISTNHHKISLYIIIAINYPHISAVNIGRVGSC
jgi:hypothetical protein